MFTTDWFSNPINNIENEKHKIPIIMWVRVTEWYINSNNIKFIKIITINVNGLYTNNK